MERNLLSRFAAEIQVRQLLMPEDKLLVAVSGGPDSMVLLDLFRRLGNVKFGIFHLNHQLREQASAEAAFVEEIGNQLGVAVHLYNYDVKQYSKDTKVSVETAARTIRYQMMEQCLKEYGYTKIALGHHRDDQVETILMHLFRGSGISGLTGIAWQRNYYIRPLLGIDKAEIISYCQHYDIPYCHDLTNFTTEYTRNKLRLELIPLIEQHFNPQLNRSITQMAEILRADDLELYNQTLQILSELSYFKHGVLTLDRTEFCRLSVAFQRRLLQLCITKASDTHEKIAYNQIEQLRKLITQEGGSFSYPLPLINIVGSANNIIFGAPQFQKWEEGILTIPGETVVGNYRIVTEVISSDQGSFKHETGSEYFDLGQLKLPLSYRRRQPGDRIKLFGSNHSKKVKNVFIDAKIPAYLRNEIPLICDLDEIVMIPMIRRSEKGRITASTSKILRVNIDSVKHCHSD